MLETRTINLDGIIFHINNDAFIALSNYLHEVELHLPVEERMATMKNIESGLAERFQSLLFAKNKQVIDMEIVGKIEDVVETCKSGHKKRPKVKKSKRNNTGCARVISITFRVLLLMISLPIVIGVFFLLFAFVISLFGLSAAVTTSVPFFGMEMFPNEGWKELCFVILALMIVILPIVVIIHTIVSHLKNKRGPTNRFWWLNISLWFISLIGMCMLGAEAINNMAKNDPSLISFLQLMNEENGVKETSQTMNLELPAFHSIDVVGVAELSLSNHPKQKATIHAEQLTNVSTQVKDSVLFIMVDDSHYNYVVLEIALPKFKHIRVGGTCKMQTIEGRKLVQDSITMHLSGVTTVDMHLQTKHLYINAKGTNHLLFEGYAYNAEVILTGAARLQAMDLLVQDMHINCAGASRAEISVQNQLWAQAAGSTKILYRGEPNILQKIAVGGSLIEHI